MANNQEQQIDDLDEIPFYIRESVQKIIDKKVQERVHEEMSSFKEVIRAELADQKVQNQVQIGHHTHAGRPGTAWMGRDHRYGGYGGQGGYGAGYPHHPYAHHGGAYPYQGGYPHHGGYYGHPGYGGPGGYPHHYGELADPHHYGPYRHVSPIR